MNSMNGELKMQQECKDSTDEMIESSHTETQIKQEQELEDEDTPASKKARIDTVSPMCHVELEVKIKIENSSPNDETNQETVTTTPLVLDPLVIIQPKMEGTSTGDVGPNETVKPILTENTNQLESEQALCKPETLATDENKLAEPDEEVDEPSVFHEKETLQVIESNNTELDKSNEKEESGDLETNAQLDMDGIPEVNGEISIPTTERSEIELGEKTNERSEPGEDFQCDPPSNQTAVESKGNEDKIQKNTEANSKGPKGRRLTFPEKLMELLNSEDCRESMSWLPNGNAFALHQPKFTRETLPKHFEGTKFESFTRKLNRWGFKRIAGEDAPEETFAYSHHLFKRDLPELCRGMSGGKKMEQDFSHLLRYREGERLINSAAANPAAFASMFGGIPGVPGLGMQPALGQQQVDFQRMLLERQMAAAGGMACNPYGNFGSTSGGFDRDRALREMLLRQDVTAGQNANAALFLQQQQQQQQQFARFGQPIGPGQLQMNQMQMAQMTQLMMNQAGLPGIGQVPVSLEATMMTGGTSAGALNGVGPAISMPGANTATMLAQQQQQQQNNAEFKRLQEQRLRIQQQVAKQNIGGAGVFNAEVTGGSRQFGV